MPALLCVAQGPLLEVAKPFSVSTSGQMQYMVNFSDHLSGGCAIQVNTYEDILNAKKLLFPGVGSYGQAMDVLVERGYVEPLKEYIQVCTTAFASAQRANHHMYSLPRT